MNLKLEPGEGRRPGKRYVRQGTGQLPAIYSGSLAGLRQAEDDALRLCAGGESGTHTVSAHQVGEGMTLIRVYEHGKLTWAPGMEQGA